MDDIKQDSRSKLRKKGNLIKSRMRDKSYNIQLFSYHDTIQIEDDDDLETEIESIFPEDTDSDHEQQHDDKRVEFRIIFTKSKPNIPIAYGYTEDHDYDAKPGHSKDHDYSHNHHRYQPNEVLNHESVYFDYKSKRIHIGDTIFSADRISNFQRNGMEIVIHDGFDDKVYKIKFPSVSHAKYVQDKIKTFTNKEALSSKNNNGNILRFVNGKNNRNDEGCRSIWDCKHIDRMIPLLRLYQRNDLNDLKVQNSYLRLYQRRIEDNCSILDDYIHIISQHDEQLEEICRLIQKNNPCDSTNCQIMNRRRSNKQRDGVNDGQFGFFRDLIDGLHCHLCHLWDYGYRIRTSSVRGGFETEKDKEMKSDTKASPAVNKFQIDHASDDGTDATFMDRFYEFLTANGLGNIIEEVTGEEYDTEGIDMDITYNNQQNSNIGTFAKNKYGLIKSYLATLTGMYFFIFLIVVCAWTLF